MEFSAMVAFKDHIDPQCQQYPNPAQAFTYLIICIMHCCQIADNCHNALTRFPFNSNQHLLKKAWHQLYWDIQQKKVDCVAQLNQLEQNWHTDETIKEKLITYYVRLQTHWAQFSASKTQYVDLTTIKTNLSYLNSQQHTNRRNFLNIMRRLRPYYADSSLKPYFLFYLTTGRGLHNQAIINIKNALTENNHALKESYYTGQRMQLQLITSLQAFYHYITTENLMETISLTSVNIMQQQILNCFVYQGMAEPINTNLYRDNHQTSHLTP